MTIDLSTRDVPEKQQESEVVLSVQGVSKKFCRDLKRSLLYGVQDMGAELIGIRSKSDRLRPKEFWALNNVSFELRRGEALALVGPNGSGKTTLLRIISGLIKPDAGAVAVKGRVAPLIALGAGFNPILTGRENIYVNMSILGLSKKEIDERFDAVVEFAEIGEAIDAPVQSYSSGMAARLGFACAIHTEPDILLIDEVLAVGDVKFRNKCYRRLTNLQEHGTSFILVSHNSNAILAMCESSVYLLKGQLIIAGKTDIVLAKYEEDLFLNEGKESTQTISLPEKSVDESLGLDIVSVYFKDAQGNEIQHPISGKNLYLCVKCKAHKAISNVLLTLLIRESSGEGNPILNLSSDKDQSFWHIPPGQVEIQLQMPYCGLSPGSYVMKVYLSQQPLYVYDTVDAFRFTVKGAESMIQCSFYQPRNWSMKICNE